MNPAIDRGNAGAFVSAFDAASRAFGLVSEAEATARRAEAEKLRRLAVAHFATAGAYLRSARVVEARAEGPRSRGCGAREYRAGVSGGPDGNHGESF